MELQGRVRLAITTHDATTTKMFYQSGLDVASALGDPELILTVD